MNLQSAKFLTFVDVEEPPKMAKILDISQEQIIQELEKNVKANWKWQWLQEDVEVVINFGCAKEKCNIGEFERKVNMPGKMKCTLCDKFVNYGSRGKAAIKSHFTSDAHVQKLRLRRTNYTLVSDSSTTGADASVYGLPPAIVAAGGQRAVPKSS